MNLRQALMQQGPSLALQRAAADEIAALDAMIVRQRDLLAESGPILSDAAYEQISQWCADSMNAAVANGANSVSMPDVFVEIAAWLNCRKS